MCFSPDVFSLSLLFLEGRPSCTYIHGILELLPSICLTVVLDQWLSSCHNSSLRHIFLWANDNIAFILHTCQVWPCLTPLPHTISQVLTVSSTVLSIWVHAFTSHYCLKRQTLCVPLKISQLPNILPKSQIRMENLFSVIWSWASTIMLCDVELIAHPGLPAPWLAVLKVVFLLPDLSVELHEELQHSTNDCWWLFFKVVWGHASLLINPPFLRHKCNHLKLFFALGIL